MTKKYLFYLFRWQLSTPILAGVLWLLKDYNNLVVTIIANFIGGLIFFWVDKYIFKTNYLNPLWEIKDKVRCYDCNKNTRGFRLVKTKNYDRFNDPNPEFRCRKCSRKKVQSLKKSGIEINC